MNIYDQSLDGFHIFDRKLHNDLSGRDAEDAHPIGSITGLQDALDEKLSNPVEFIDFDLTAGAPDHRQGRIFYDTQEDALSNYNLHTQVTHNLGRETLVKCCNESGADIADGSVVYISGVNTGCPTIELADSATYEASRVIGVTTMQIPNGTFGEVTTDGKVQGIDTSALSTGTVYLGTNGGLSNTRPSGGSFAVMIGFCLVSSATAGIIYVSPQIPELSVEATNTNGFPVESASTISLSINDATRTLSISTTEEDYRFYQDGFKYRKATDSVTFADVEGLWLAYYNNGVLIALNNPTADQIATVMIHYCAVAYFYWDATNKETIYLGREMHGISMSGSTHSYLHFTRGAQWLSGLALDGFVADGSGALASHAQFGHTLGAIADEDLVFSSLTRASTIGLPIYYLSGANTLRRLDNAGFSVLTDTLAGVGSTGRLVYNQLSGGSWGLSVVGNNNFVLCHVFSINGESNNERMVAFIGQNQYTTIPSARAGAAIEIAGIRDLLPVQEKVPIGTIIFQTSDGYANAVKGRVRTNDEGFAYTDWRQSELSQGAAPTAHQNLTGTSELNCHPIGAIADLETTLSGLDSRLDILEPFNVSKYLVPTNGATTTLTRNDFGTFVRHTGGSTTRVDLPTPLAEDVGKYFILQSDEDAWLDVRASSGFYLANGTYISGRRVLRNGEQMLCRVRSANYYDVVEFNDGGISLFPLTSNTSLTFFHTKWMLLAGSATENITLSLFTLNSAFYGSTAGYYYPTRPIIIARKGDTISAGYDVTLAATGTDLIVLPDGTKVTSVVLPKNPVIIYCHMEVSTTNRHWYVIGLPHNASQIPFTPTTSTDWNTSPTTVLQALNELASRIKALEP